MTDRVKVFDNFDDLKENIRKHNKETEGDVTIIPANSPLDLWKIRLIDLQRWYGDENGFNRNNMFGSGKTKVDGAIALSNYANTFFK